MNVPLLDLKLQYKSLKNEIDETLIRVAESQNLILGEEVSKLEKSLAEYCGCAYAIGVSSGTDALLMALMALELKPGDQVILPDYSFFATAGVVSRLGATPVFVDCDPVTFNIIPAGIEAKINARTKAIIPVHLYGQAADMDEILAIAEAHNIPVIEDAAQAIGVDYKDHRPVGSMGMCGCFSFYPTKNLGAFGDGGLITTNDEELYKKFIQMRNHGMEPKYYHKFIGGNFRLDAIQAAVLNVKFPHLEKWNHQRRANTELYNKLFKAKGLAEKTGITEFNDNNKVLLPKAVHKSLDLRNYHTYNQYIIRVEKRDECRQFLTTNNVSSEIYYPVPFHEQECFANINSSAGISSGEGILPSIPSDASHYSNSIFNARHSLALPIFPELSEEQISFVVDKIEEFINK